MGKKTVRPTRSVTKILWPIDASVAETGVQRTTAQTIKMLAVPTEAQVEPVYILSPEQLNMSLDTPLPWLDQYKPAAEEALESAVKNFSVPKLLKPRVLVETSASTSAAVRLLSRHAAQSGADLIVIGTHARKGMPRLFLGSFTESLLNEAKIPVLIVNPKTRPQARIRHILFATDLGRQSWAAFRKVTHLAKDLGASLTVFHAIPHPAGTVARTGDFLMSAGWLAVPDFVEEELNARRKTGERWLEAARKMGIDVELGMELTKQDIVSAILSAARNRKAGMIALAAQSGPVASVLIGSVTRQVVREAETPVWVVRAGGQGTWKRIRQSGP